MATRRVGYVAESTTIEDDLQLTDAERAMLHGDEGGAVALAMRVLAAVGTAVGAERLIDVSAAHIDGALYVGRASLDYATRLRELGGRVRVRTTLNVSSLDLLHPELFRGDPTTAQAARETMQAYEDMGCIPTWTCAPYQLLERPRFGDTVAWAESNAVVFANSVLGARTERLGDFVDIAAAITGRIPEYGLYLDADRRAGVRFDVSELSARLLGSDHFFAVLGLVIGAEAGRAVPVVTGIPAATEDQLKALGAGAATTGAVALVHVVGVTPEAPTLAAIADADVPLVEVTKEHLTAAAERLTSGGGPLTTVNLGTPHYSQAQIARLTELLDGRSVHGSVTLYVNTGRDELAAVPNVDALERQGVVFVTDTCTYLTPIIEPSPGLALSDSAKWVYYAPGNIGVSAAFATTTECVESAVRGTVVRNAGVWE